MELRFQHDLDDDRDYEHQINNLFQRVAASKLSSLSWIYYLCLSMAIIGIVMFLVDNPSVNVFHLHCAISFLIAREVCGLFYSRRYRILWSEFSKSQVARYEDQQVRIDEAGITHESSHTRLSCDWPSIRKYTITGRQIFHHLSDASALCVPRRAFHSPDAEKEWIEFVKHNINGSNNIRGN